MTPFKQHFLHDPDKGIDGDCFRTVIACLLDVHPSDVPHVYSNGATTEDGNTAIQNYLADRGLTLARIALAGTMEQIMHGMKVGSPGIHYLLSGKSPRGFDHVVVCLDDAIVHDPHPDGTGITDPCDGGVYWVEILVPLSMRSEA